MNESGQHCPFLLFVKLANYYIISCHCLFNSFLDFLQRVYCDLTLASANLRKKVRREMMVMMIMTGVAILPFDDKNYCAL